ncbi:conserved hypothetical protein [Sinorhizobium medicae]|uniref:Uncharacterized protein n=1 Tax=Sinorhizobium medicae TaxID=110321 RepID=A0A508XAP2_9HYPH|nr:conserved hypothetical protein [Sinorhizobium medicae]
MVCADAVQEPVSGAGYFLRSRRHRSLTGSYALLVDLGFDEPCQISQRFLPTKIASLEWNDVGYAFLHDLEFGTDRYFLQRHGHLHLAGQVGVVEFVRVAQTFAGDEFDIFTAKGVAFTRREVPEGHFEGAAGFWLQMMHGAGKAIRRKPFRERVGFEERAIEFLRAGGQNAVQSYSVGHDRLSLRTADGSDELPIHAPRTNG